MKKVLLILGLGLVLAGAAFATYQWQRQAATDSALPVNTRLGGELVLPSTQGHNFDLKAERGKVVLLSFGYTSCPDICPTVLARLHQVVKGLGGEAGQVDVVFVSFDPARDTLDHLRQYVSFFDPRIIGATGTDAQIAAVAQRYGAVYIREDQGARGYDFAHSDYIYLLDTQGRVRKLYDDHATSTDMQQDVRRLLQEGHWVAGLK